ncbi:MAG: GNAT family N-acetyltransferase [Clostridia bacterium]|nr:GNAT family N-acetyltransferase [Clostridia bacterium]
MITYRTAYKTDLKAIAKVHSACFKEYFLTSLGNDLLSKYYGEYIDENAPFILAVNEHGQIAGFCMGYLTGSKARDKFESKYKWQLTSKLLGLCLMCNKNAWVRVSSKIKDVLKSFKSKNQANINPEKPKGSILSICVMEEFRGTNVAGTLVDKFESELKDRNIETYTLSVYTTNARARAFYEKKGFSVLNENKDSTNYIKTIS